MRPRPDMVTVDADDTIESAIAVAIERGFSRIPACGETTDDVIGLVYLKDLVRRARAGEGEQPVRIAVRPATFVPEQKRVAELLREMQTEQFHMAVVIDEYGDTVGVVTLEDLLEEIVGEIADEYDVEEPGIEHLPDGSLRFPGRTPIDEVNEELDTELPDTEWDTIGGFVLNLLGHVPEEGESVDFPGFELRAEQVHDRRIGAVHVRRVAAADASTDAAEVRRRRRRRRDGQRRGIVTDPTSPGVPLGVRLARRPPQRGEVDAGEPAGRHEGGDRLRPPADHPHADPRRAHHGHVAARAARHPGDPQAPHAARRAHQRAGALHARRGRRRSASSSRPPARSAPATATSRGSCSRSRRPRSSW